MTYRMTIDITPIDLILQTLRVITRSLWQSLKSHWGHGPSLNSMQHQISNNRTITTPLAMRDKDRTVSWGRISWNFPQTNLSNNSSSISATPGSWAFYPSNRNDLENTVTHIHLIEGTAVNWMDTWHITTTWTLIYLVLSNSFEALTFVMNPEVSFREEESWASNSRMGHMSFLVMQNIQTEPRGHDHCHHVYMKALGFQTFLDTFNAFPERSRYDHEIICKEQRTGHA